MQLKILKNLSNIGENILINKLIKKKSIYLTGLKRLKIKETFQKIANDDIIIKVDSCGICSSDLKFIYTGSRIKKYPIIKSL